MDLGKSVRHRALRDIVSRQAIRTQRELATALKRQGIPATHMHYAGWGDGLRITVGTDDEIDAFLACLKTI